MSFIAREYRGEKAIKLSGYSTPVNVLEAYEEFKRIREEKGDEFRLEEALTSIQMDSDIKRSISRMCFEFVQQLVLKKPQILESKRAFGGMYTQWNNQGMQCCLFPRDDNDSLLTLTYCQSQWSLLIRRVIKLVRDYQERKAKETH